MNDTNDMNDIQPPVVSAEAKKRKRRAINKRLARPVPDEHDFKVISIHYFTAMDGVLGYHRPDGAEPNDACFAPPALGMLTFCVLVLQNGFTVTGESICCNPKKFNVELERREAFWLAQRKIEIVELYAHQEEVSRGELD